MRKRLLITILIWFFPFYSMQRSFLYHPLAPKAHLYLCIPKINNYLRCSSIIFKRDFSINSCNQMKTHTQPWHHIFSIFALGAAWCAAQVSSSAYADINQESSLTVESIIQEFQHNRNLFIKKLENNQLQAHQYAIFIAQHYDEFMQSDTSSLIIDLLNAKKINHDNTKEMLITAMGNFIENNFVATITSDSGLKTLQYYCDDLRKNSQEKDNCYEQKMKSLAQRFVNSFEEIMANLPCATLSDFFYYIVPHFETVVLTDHKDTLCELFQKYHWQLADLCRFKNSYTLFMIIKLFIKPHREEHECIFVDELFKRYDIFEDLYYLGIIETKQARIKAIEHIIKRKITARHKQALMNTLFCWISNDPSLALPLATEDCINSLLQSREGLALIPLIKPNIPLSFHS